MKLAVSEAGMAGLRRTGFGLGCVLLIFLTYSLWVKGTHTRNLAERNNFFQTAAFGDVTVDKLDASHGVAETASRGRGATDGTTTELYVIGSPGDPKVVENLDEFRRLWNNNPTAEATLRLSLISFGEHAVWRLDQVGLWREPFAVRLLRIVDPARFVVRVGIVGGPTTLLVKRGGSSCLIEGVFLSPLAQDCQDALVLQNSLRKFVRLTGLEAGYTRIGSSEAGGRQ